MARPSKLSEKQWAEVERRMLNGEKAIDLAKEYKVDRSALTRRLSHQNATVKHVANQMLSAEVALRSLPVAQQVSAINLMDQLRSISGHLAGAANFGASTAHRLAGIANGKVALIDDAAPLSEESMIELKGIAALTRMANEASEIGVNLLRANKDQIDEANKGQLRTIRAAELGDDELAAIATTSGR